MTVALRLVTVLLIVLQLQALVPGGGGPIAQQKKLVVAPVTYDSTAHGHESDPYAILWSSGSTLSDAELVAAGTVPHMVQNWSPHDTPAPHSVTCSPATPHIPCILSLFPLIQKAPLPNLNGGVPQAANLTTHLAQLRKSLPSGIPANYTGVAAIDFENWTPIWDNDNRHDSWHSAAYRELSISLVKKAHPGYTDAEATAAAQTGFETAALNFFLETLKVCQEVRPNARWGYYGFPNAEFYPCDSSGCGYQSKNGPTFRAQNDKLQPLWEAVDVLLPSVYMQYLCPSAQCPASWNTTNREEWNSLINARMINGTVKEAVRLQKSTKRKPPVYAYTWAYYNTVVVKGQKFPSTLLSSPDIKASIEVPYSAGAQGVVIWGDPTYHQEKDPGRVGRFNAYFRSTLAPEILAFNKTLPPA